MIECGLAAQQRAGILVVKAIWIEMEYFVHEGDALWSLPDAQMFELAVGEMVKIRVINREDVLDHVVIRMAKTYPPISAPTTASLRSVTI